MITRLFNAFKKPKEIKSEQKIIENPKHTRINIWSTDDAYANNIYSKIEAALDRNFQKVTSPETAIALDSNSYKNVMDNIQSVKSSFYGNEVIPNQQLLWYANQTFIGYQLCAMLAQQWLISKACLMPAEDAVRKGYEITVNDGT